MSNLTREDAERGLMRAILCGNQRISKDTPDSTSWLFLHTYASNNHSRIPTQRQVSVTAERRRLASAYRQRVSTGGLVNNHPLAASDGGDPSSDVVLGDPAGTGAGSAVNNNAARPSPDAALDIDSEEQAPQITLEDNKKLAIKPKFVHIRQRLFTRAMMKLSQTNQWKAVPVLIAEAGHAGLPLNVICLNAAMSVLAKSGRWLEALNLLDKMRRGTLLVEVGDGGDGNGEKRSSLTLPVPNDITYNAAINACGRGKRWKNAVDLLDTMRQEGVTPDAFSYSAAVSACHKCGQWKMALQLLDSMHQQGLERNIYALNAAIAACASAGRWRPALKILHDMEKQGPDPSLFTYSSAIDACARGGQLDLAVKMLRGMQAAAPVGPKPNRVCYNVVLQVLAREGRWRDARELLTEAAKAQGEEGEQDGALDYLCYNSVIRACASVGELEEAFKTRDEMHSAGIGSDRIAYDALAAGCGLVGDWEAAETLVREMLAARDRAMSKDAAPAGVATEIDPELGSQTSKTSDAISSASSTGDNTTSDEGGRRARQEWALKWKRRRRKQLEDGVRPSAMVFRGLMEAYARAGEWQRALDCLDDMSRSVEAREKEEEDDADGIGVGAGVTPDATCFGWGIQACAAAGKWDRALSLFLGMRTEGIRPDQLCFDSALLACAKGGEGLRAVSMLSEMEGLAAEAEEQKRKASAEGNSRHASAAATIPPAVAGWGPAFGMPVDSSAPKPTIESYKLCMEACRRGRDTTGVLSVLARMRAEGISPDLACFNEALEACAAGGGRWERALAFLDEMQYAGIVPDRFSYAALLRSCESSSGDEDAAEAAYTLIRTMTSSSTSIENTNTTTDGAPGVGSSDGASATTQVRVDAPTLMPTARDFLAALRTCANSGSWSLALDLLTQAKQAAATAAEQGGGTEGGNVRTSGVSGVEGVSTEAAAEETDTGSKEPFGMLMSELYHGAISACGRGGNTAGVLSLLSEMRQGGRSEEGGTGGGEVGLSIPGVSAGDVAKSAEEPGVGGVVDEAAERVAEATRAAMSAGMIPALSPAMYAVAAEALADAGEWEWCLVLVEELEQQMPDEVMIGATTSAANDRANGGRMGDKGAREDDVDLEVALDADGLPCESYCPPENRSGTDAVGAETAPKATMLEARRDQVMATYTAAVRACGRGRADLTAVIGVLERTRWAGLAPDERTYAAAIRAVRECAGSGDESLDLDMATESLENRGNASEHEMSFVTAGAAARALIEWEDDRRGGVVSPFLFSAAIKVCAEMGEVDTARALFVEGRKSSGVKDAPQDVARAAVAAAEAAVRSGKSPEQPARINRGLEAIYRAVLTVCVAAGDGSLARDVLRWMKMEGFKATESSYVLAIKACCTPPPPAQPKQVTTTRSISLPSRSTRTTIPTPSAPAATTVTSSGDTSPPKAYNSVETQQARKDQPPDSDTVETLPQTLQSTGAPGDKAPADAADFEWVVIPGGRAFPPADDEDDDGDRQMSSTTSSPTSGRISSSTRTDDLLGKNSPEPVIPTPPVVSSSFTPSPETLPGTTTEIGSTARGKSGEEPNTKEVAVESRDESDRGDTETINGSIPDAHGVDWERALAILSDMEAAQLVPPTEAFEAVLAACATAGRAGEALEIAQIMCGIGYTPDARLMARLTREHSSELEMEAREIRRAADGPPQDWGVEGSEGTTIMSLSGDGALGR